MNIVLNGAPTQVPDGATVAQLLTESTGCAAAVNGEVVPRSRLDATRLADGDVVDVVTAVQGG